MAPLTRLFGIGLLLASILTIYAVLSDKFVPEAIGIEIVLLAGVLATLRSGKS